MNKKSMNSNINKNQDNKKSINSNVNNKNDNKKHFKDNDGINKMKMKKQKEKKKFLQDSILMILFLVLSIILIKLYPDKKEHVLKVSFQFFKEMIYILPAVMILMALFNVYVSNDLVIKYLGKKTGIKAILVGIVLGSLPTGPLYIAFPVASALIKKGAKVSSIIAFLSAWACIKIPQEMVELQFLGAKFMVARLILTIIFVIIMSLFIELIVKDEKGKNEN